MNEMSLWGIILYLLDVFVYIQSIYMMNGFLNL